MMGSTAILAVKVVSDASQAARELDSFSGSTSTMGDKLGRADRAAKATVLGIAAVGAAAFKQASDLQQASGAVDSVFRKQADQVHELARGAAEAVGLARSEYSDLASVLGAQLRNLGVDEDKLVGTTDRLITTGADLAATFGGSSKEAVEALSAALRGETDPIERYGISIKEATVQAYLAKKGQDDLRGAALRQAETQARLALITKQSAAAQGQFAEESDTAAVQSQIAYAKLKNAGAAAGAILLPIAAALASRFADVAGWVEKNAGVVQALVGVTLGLSAAVIAVNAGYKVYLATSRLATAATKAWAVAQKILNLAMRANPVGLIITAVTILVGLIVLAYKRSERFRAIVRAVARGAAAAWGWVIAKIKDLIGWVGKVVGWVRGKLVAAWTWYRQRAVAAVTPVISFLGKLIGWVGKVVGWVRDKLVAAFSWYKSRAVAAVQAVIGFVSRIIDGYARVVSWVRDKLVGAFTWWKDRVVAVIGGIRDLAVRVIDGYARVVDWVRDRLVGAFTYLKDKAADAIQAIIGPVQTLIGWVESLLDKLNSISIPDIDLPNIPGVGLVAGQRVAGSPTLGPPGSPSGASGPAPVHVTFNIDGALDPVAVARQVRQLLIDEARRAGRRAVFD